MQIVIKKVKFSNAFSKLGEGEMSHEVFSTTEEYVCSVNGFKCDYNKCSYKENVCRKIETEICWATARLHKIIRFKQIQIHRVELFISNILKRHDLSQNYTKLHIWYTQ